MELHFLRTLGVCLSEFTTHFACTNIESLVMTYGEVLEAFDVPFFNLPHSRQMHSSFLG